MVSDRAFKNAPEEFNFVFKGVCIGSERGLFVGIQYLPDPVQRGSPILRVQKGCQAETGRPETEVKQAVPVEFGLAVRVSVYVQIIGQEEEGFYAVLLPDALLVEFMVQLDFKLITVVSSYMPGFSRLFCVHPGSLPITREHRGDILKRQRCPLGNAVNAQEEGHRPRGGWEDPVPWCLYLRG